MMIFQRLEINTYGRARREFMRSSPGEIGVTEAPKNSKMIVGRRDTKENLKWRFEIESSCG